MFFWDERLRCVGAKVVVELVHVPQGLVWLPAFTGFSESSPAHLELKGGSSITTPTVGDDGLDDELLFVVLGYYQWRGVCWIVVEGSEVMAVGRCALPTDEILPRLHRLSLSSPLLDRDRDV